METTTAPATATAMDQRKWKRMKGEGSGGVDNDQTLAHSSSPKKRETKTPPSSSLAISFLTCFKLARFSLRIWGAKQMQRLAAWPVGL